MGVLAAAHVAVLVLEYVWRAVSLSVSHLWRGTTAVAHIVSFALRYLWVPVGALFGYLWLGVSTIVRLLRLGVSTAALVLVWMLGQLQRGVAIILQGVRATPRLAMRTLWTAYDTVPDFVRLFVWVVRHRKGGPTMSELNLTRERTLSLVITVLVFFTVGAVGVRILLPAPPEPTVEVTHWVTGHLYYGAKLPDIAARYSEAGHRTTSGKRIVVGIYNAPSSEGARALLARVTGSGSTKVDAGGGKQDLPDPTIVTPSGAHWLVTVNHGAGWNVVDPDTARSIAQAYIGIITFRDMAECLGWPNKEIGYADIIALRNDPDGWESYDCAKPSWGKRPLVAFTDPRTSSTGRSVLIALYSIAAGKLPEELTVADVSDPEKEGIARIKVGPKTVTVTAPPVGHEMVMLYPKEGSMARNNCACIVDADWVTTEQVEAAEHWIDFIQEDEQQRLFMAAGFRPTAGLPLTDASSKINRDYGLDMTKPTKELNPEAILPEVAAAIDASWEDVKRPGIVTFVVDTSGSMLGTKLKQAKDGMDRALDAMASNNKIGFITFNDEINIRIPVEPLAGNGYAIDEAVHKMRARGETALFDAIKAGIEMTDAAEGDEQAIRAVVVLTDGQANRCQTRLDNLIEMESSNNEKAITRFGGCEGDPAARDVNGATVENKDIIGTRLAIETEHPIQVFFIGIGDDADLEVGRMLAEATGAEFQGVTEEDLANLLEEFSGYF